MFNINNIFGPTIQGEGSNLIGLKTMFIRVSGCDYKCGGCDSKYAWEKGEILTKEQILKRLIDLDNSCKNVTITGGNPCLYDLSELIDLLKKNDYKINVETQGSIFREWLKECDLVTLSPKPLSTGMKTDFLILKGIIDFCNKNNVEVCLKVIVGDDNDYEYAKSLHLDYPDVKFTFQVFNELRRDTYKDLIKKLDWLVNKIIMDSEINGEVYVLPQLHVLIWGNVRGK